MMADCRARDGTVRGRGPKTPDAPPPGVFQGRFVDPTSRAVHPVAACARESLRVVQEPQRNSRQTVQRSLGAGLSAGDDEHPRYVVGAVTMLGQRLGEPSVL